MYLSIPLALIVPETCRNYPYVDFSRIWTCWQKSHFGEPSWDLACSRKPHTRSTQLNHGENDRSLQYGQGSFWEPLQQEVANTSREVSVQALPEIPMNHRVLCTGATVTRKPLTQLILSWFSPQRHSYWLSQQSSNQPWCILLSHVCGCSKKCSIVDCASKMSWHQWCRHEATDCHSTK